MKTHPCCDCGTELMTHPDDGHDKLSLCLECWKRLTIGTLASRSKAHEREQHPGCKGV